MKSTARALIFSRPAVFVTLIAAFSLVAASVVLSVVSTRAVSAADRRVAHAQQTLAVINRLLATINEAETAQRGYILTEDPKYLAPYEAALPRYREELSALYRQVETDAARTAVVRQLGALCEQRFSEIARTVRLRREHGIAPALNVLESDEGWRLMNEIRQRLQSLQREEMERVASSTAAAGQEARRYQLSQLGLLFVALALTAGLTWVVVRRLHELEGLIKVCAWTQRVQWKGRWVTFEEYLAERFNLHCTHGMSEEAAERLSKDVANTPVPPEA